MLATELTGRTRSYWLPNILALTARTEENPFFCRSGSLFLRRLARSSSTSYRLSAASMVSFTSLPPLLSLLRRVSFWIISLCSMASISRW